MLSDLFQFIWNLIFQINILESNNKILEKKREHASIILIHFTHTVLRYLNNFEQLLNAEKSETYTG